MMSAHRLEYMLLRFPALAQRIHGAIDAMHASGHKHCSPLYNHKFNVLTCHVNAVLNEQRNRLINYMKSSAAKMGQVRAMVYIRYHIAMLNLDMIMARKFSTNEPTLPTYVFDGVRVGISCNTFHPQRPYERPYNYQEARDHGAGDLYFGCAPASRLMIPGVGHRKTLWDLASGIEAGEEECSSLLLWMKESRPCLLSFVQISDGRLETRRIGAMLPLLKHWSSTAPESLALPAMLVPLLREIMAEEVPALQPAQSAQIQRWSRVVYDLLLLRLTDVDHAHADATGYRIDPAVAALLSVMCTLTLKCFEAESGDLETRPWPPRDHAALHEFEEMVRTASYAPQHPVIRQLPYFRYDRMNAASRHRRRAAAVQQDDLEFHDLMDISQSIGVTCNKYRDRASSRISPGLFTVFYAGCCVCVAFELMACVESPQTAFNTFALRAFTDAEMAAHRVYLEGGEWKDPACVLLHRREE
jgi:hypothetical protein